MDDARTFPYEDNPGGTHFEGCWHTPKHHNCAVHRVYSLESRLEAYETALIEWAATGAPYEHTGAVGIDGPPRCIHDHELWPCAAIRMVRLLPKDVLKAAEARLRELSGQPGEAS